MFKTSKSAQTRLLELAREQGVIRPKDLRALGISRTHLGNMVKTGVMRTSGRGLYSLVDFDFSESHSKVIAVKVQLRGVICLTSALSFHEVGTQVPHDVWVAIPRGVSPTKQQGTPIRVVVMARYAYETGIETHEIEGVDVPIYSVAKSVVDCFKYRKRVGLDVALEALQEVLRERRCSPDEIMHYAKCLRVEEFMIPYVEALSL